MPGSLHGGGSSGVCRSQRMPRTLQPSAAFARNLPQLRCQVDDPGLLKGCLPYRAHGYLVLHGPSKSPNQGREQRLGGVYQKFRPASDNPT